MSQNSSNPEAKNSQVPPHGGTAADNTPTESAHHSSPNGGMSVTRRTMIGSGIGIALGALGANALTNYSNEKKSDEFVPHPGSAGGIVEFYGDRQPGITTPVQDRAHFAAFDITTDSKDDVIELLKEWTAAIAHVMAGEDIGEFGSYNGPYEAPPQDTGEAVGLPPSNLSVTVGFGRSLFVTADGVDRFGLKDKLPDALIDLPHFPADNTDFSISDGDIIVQACADDPQVAVHAVRNLARIGRGRVKIRWSSLGFGRTSATTPDQDTPRNLFGFKDGTKSIKSDETKDLDAHVFAKRDDWMDGGTFMVFRKIRMHIETWDRTRYREQEEIFGRTKREGAPLTGGHEHDEPDFEMLGHDGLPLMMVDAHVTLVHPKQNHGVRLLRRSYNYTDGADQLGRLDAGLLFVAFFTDPRTHYVPMQTSMSANDQLMEYIQFISRGLYAIPKGVQNKDGWIGQTLFL